jgi:LysM repeat protein
MAQRTITSTSTTTLPQVTSTTTNTVTSTSTTTMAERTVTSTSTASTTITSKLSAQTVTTTSIPPAKTRTATVTSEVTHEKTLTRTATVTSELYRANDINNDTAFIDSEMALALAGIMIIVSIIAGLIIKRGK